MFLLVCTTRDELIIHTEFHPTKEDAIDAMIQDMIRMTNSESLDELLEKFDEDETDFSKTEEAWVETRHAGTGHWKIIEVPEVSTLDNFRDMPTKNMSSLT